MLLFENYLREASFRKFVEFQNDSSVLNITGSRRCILVEEKEAGYVFSCKEPVLTGLTLALIYWPAIKIISILLGPRTAGKLGMGWGALMFSVGGLVETLVTGSSVAPVMGWFLMSAGVPMIALSILLIFVQSREEASEKGINVLTLVPQFITFPFI